MAKLLNVDSFLNKERFLVLAGKQYPVREILLEDFIFIQEKMAELAGVEDAIVQVDASVKLILRMTEGLTEELLRKIPMTKLEDIVLFIRGADELEGVEDTDAKAELEKSDDPKQ